MDDPKRSPSPTRDPIALPPAADPEVAAPRRTQPDAWPWAGYGLAAAGAILFASKGIFIKFAYAEGVDTETLLAIRMALSVPIYAAIGAVAAARNGWPPTLDGRALAKVAAVGALGYWFASYMDFLGLVYVSAPFERLILFTYPLFTVLMGAAFFSQPFRRSALAAFAVSYAGLALVFVKDVEAAGFDATMTGTALVLCSAVAFGLYQLFAKGLIGRFGPGLFTCLAMSAAGAVAMAQFLLVRDVAVLAELTTRAWIICALLATVGTVAPSFLLSAALHRISAQSNAAIGTVSPIATLILAALFLGEQVTAVDLAGAALVVAGVGWFTLGERRRG